MLSVLARYIPEREVRAFGSRVNGAPKRFSDLDLVIMGEERLPSEILAYIRDAFEESDLPFKVDLLEWLTTGDSFRHVIERGFVVMTTGIAQKG